MVATYSLAPEPIWYIVNLDGTAAGGAQLFTWSNINPTIPKPVYRDPEGNEAWPNPILFGLNGTNAPIYFKFDPALPDDTYFLEARNADDVQLWTVENFFPPSGGGGGGNTTTILPIRNYIANNQFIDNIPNTSSPIGNTNLVIAPSNHQGFTPTGASPIVGTYGGLGPDIRFVSNVPSVAATDQISFVTFPLNVAPMFPTDVTPVQYVRYQCTGAASGEQFKAFQFPITQKVKNLSNQLMTFTIWAKVTTTPVNIALYTRQYYGSSPTATSEGITTRVLQDTYTLSSTWTQYSTNFTMPDVSANSLGTPGAQTDDDAVYLQLQMPLDSTCDVQFTKPALYLGTLPKSSEFQDYDDINSVNSTPRCGDIRASLTASAPPGWVAMNDGSIGNVGSNATTRANADTFQLYKTIWDAVSNTYAPLQNSSGTPISRGGSAVSDFLANNRLVLPRSLGRAMAGAGSGSGLTATTLGEWQGAESNAITLSMLPVGAPYNTALVTGDIVVNSVVGGTVHVPGSAFNGYSGNLAPTNLSVIQPTTYFNVFIKL